MRLSKISLQSLKKKIQEYQIDKYPELSKSLVNHGNKKKEYALLSEKEYQYKLRAGRATDKEQLIGMLKTCYKKANSKDDFFEMLKESELSTYIRGGRISGVIFKNKKFRLNRLGFTEEKIEQLNKENERVIPLHEFRKKKESKNKEKNFRR